MGFYDPLRPWDNEQDARASHNWDRILNHKYNMTINNAIRRKYA